MGIHNPFSKYKIIFKLKIFGVTYIMGIQNSGSAAVPKTEKDVNNNVLLAVTVSTEILAANVNRIKWNITNNNPNASMWITSDPAIAVATTAFPCIEIPVGANGDFESNTAVRAVWPAGTTGAGCKILETISV
jgi:hypothetical protein